MVQNPTREALRAIADAMLLGDDVAKKAALGFFTQESTGLWHNRARALIARRLKHVTLAPEEKAALVATVNRRLSTGSFSEQFGDQLKMAIALDPASVEQCALECMISTKAHVVRYAKRVLRATQGRLPPASATGSCQRGPTDSVPVKRHL